MPAISRQCCDAFECRANAERRHHDNIMTHLSQLLHLDIPKHRLAYSVSAVYSPTTTVTNKRSLRLHSEITAKSLWPALIIFSCISSCSAVASPVRLRYNGWTLALFGKTDQLSLRLHFPQYWYRVRMFFSISKRQVYFMSCKVMINLFINVIINAAKGKQGHVCGI